MINIRRNCFETNSSSMHSLVVSKIIKPYTEKELCLGYDDWYKEKNKNFDLWDWMDPGDMVFERSPFQVLRTPKDKLRYYVAYKLGTYKTPKKSDIKRIEDFIMKQTGITDRKKIVLYKIEDDWYGKNKLRKNKTYGAVYANDTGETPMHYVEKNGITMEDLILNPKYTIIIDGDESQDFKALFEAGIINADDLDDISSGADFWNDAETSIYINWFDEEEETEEGITEFLKDRIFDYTKIIAFKSEFFANEENLKMHEREYQLGKERTNNIIKNIIKKAKETNPKIKTKFCAYSYSDQSKLSMNDLKDIDLSIYDMVEVEDFDDEEWK